MGVCFIHTSAHLFVLEGLHQLGHPTESHGEGQTGAAVAVGYLDALVGKVPLPVCIMAQFILTKDVRDEVPYVEEKEENIVFCFVFYSSTFTASPCEPTTDKKKPMVLLSLLAGVKWSIKKAKKL